MTYPKISIVTVSYNQATYLETTIKSVLEQNYPNLEYIIIDGGSTDGSLEIIKKYAHALAYYESAKDNGMYDALNKGFSRATGDIMAWINSDDMYISNAFFVVAELFSKFQNINWLSGTPVGLDENNRIISIGSIRKWSKYNYYLRDYRWIQQESVFWRKSLWLKAGGKIDDSLKLAGDFELWLRFFSHEKLYTVNAPLGCFRLRSKDQKSLDFLPEYIQEVNNLLNKEQLSDKDKIILQKIEKYRRLLKIPYSHRIFPGLKKYEKLFEYPEDIVFDRRTQQYILK